MEAKGIKVDLLDIESIKPYENNAKIHSDAQIRKLANSMKKFGFNNPITVDKDFVIISGHGRRLAAQYLGLKKVPVIVRDDLSKEEANTLRLVDNRVVSNEYNTEMLKLDISYLMADSDVDLVSLGFDDREIEYMIRDLGKFSLDSVVEDISEAVETQKEQNDKAIQIIDEKEVPIGDVFGFKRVKISEARQLKDIIGLINNKTGKTGVESIIEFFQNSSFYE